MGETDDPKKRRRPRPLLLAGAGLVAIAMGCPAMTSGNLVAMPCNPDGSFTDCSDDLDARATDGGSSDAGDGGDGGAVDPDAGDGGS